MLFHKNNEQNQYGFQQHSEQGQCAETLSQPLYDLAFLPEIRDKQFLKALACK